MAGDKTHAASRPATPPDQMDSLIHRLACKIAAVVRQVQSRYRCIRLRLRLGLLPVILDLHVLVGAMAVRIGRTLLLRTPSWQADTVGKERRSRLAIILIATL